jgi:serine/threonine protein kinase
MKKKMMITLINMIELLHHVHIPTLLTLSLSLSQIELVDGGDLHSYLASTPNYNEGDVDIKHFGSLDRTKLSFHSRITHISTHMFLSVLAAKQFKQILQGLHYLHSLGRLISMMITKDRL